ncbi:MAG: HPr family phosphocarrier protein [Gammaproteobacteria bacterium]|nr:HPr family phosphocarrier protein [Gammaproteobacteria bacterium]HRX70193.1 HPr family phosphocarrier protein [Candidatus Competibacteraceae bacterium]
MVFVTDIDNVTTSESPVIIDYESFSALTAPRAHQLLRLARLLSTERSHTTLTRPLVADLLSHAIQIEEFLDAYGARNNRQWSRFRSLTATIKLFADISYKLLHIQHSLPSYQLPAIQRNFTEVTAQTLAFTYEILVRASVRILTKAAHLNLPTPTDDLNKENYREPLPPGRLPRDRAMRQVSSTAETVIHVATAYLNLASESQLLHIVEWVKPSQYPSCFPDPLSEDKLRHLQLRFHSLQALYDTHIAETEVESLDTDLPVLRGYISIVFHLLEIATQLIHHYERHLNAKTGDASLRRNPVVSTRALLAMLMNYAIAYAGQYLSDGRCLCHALLKRYAEVGKVEVPVPSYRGFHVRPATLIAKIAQHYGSAITMELDEQCYDASSPMDIFRANERINARKRRWLALQIGNLWLPTIEPSDHQIRATVLNVVLRLAEQGKIIIYQQPLQLSEEFTRESIFLEKITTEIARLMATGQIDIKTDMNITFTGDKRVLSDLELLANCGYGEDKFGNNVTLPRELAYLRR